MAQNRTCNLSVTGRPSSPLRHVLKVPTCLMWLTPLAYPTTLSVCVQLFELLQEFDATVVASCQKAFVTAVPHS
jgi:hypothetical protein